jgi:hypothetical protein
MEALTNVKTAVLNGNYPDKLTQDEQYLILKEMGRMLCGTPKGSCHT